MVFVEIDSMVVQTTRITTTTWMLSMLAWMQIEKKKSYINMYIINIINGVEKWKLC